MAGRRRGVWRAGEVLVTTSETEAACSLDKSERESEAAGCPVEQVAPVGRGRPGGGREGGRLL